MRRDIGQTMTRFKMCDIACKDYSKAMTPANIQAAFRKKSIYSSDKAIVPHTSDPTEGFCD